MAGDPLPVQSGTYNMLVTKNTWTNYCCQVELSKTCWILHMVKAQSHRPKRIDCVWIANKSWLWREFYAICRGCAWRAICAWITYESCKNGINCVKNTLIRATGPQSVCEAVLNLQLRKTRAKVGICSWSIRNPSVWACVTRPLSSKLLTYVYNYINYYIVAFITMYQWKGKSNTLSDVWTDITITINSLNVCKSIMHLSFVCTPLPPPPPPPPSNPGDFPFWRSEKHRNVTDPGTNFGWNFPYRWDRTLNLITILVLWDLARVGKVPGVWVVALECLGAIRIVTENRGKSPTPGQIPGGMDMYIQMTSA